MLLVATASLPQPEWQLLADSEALLDLAVVCHCKFMQQVSGDDIAVGFRHRIELLWTARRVPASLSLLASFAHS